MSEILPVEHFNYDEVDASCRCALCKTRLRMLDALEAARTFIEKSEVLSSSEVRRQVRKNLEGVQREFLRESTKRDVYSELSFLVRNKKWKQEFLGWVARVVQKTDWKSAGWWTHEVGETPLYWWFERWAYEDCLANFTDSQVVMASVSIKSQERVRTRVVAGHYMQHAITKLWVGVMPSLKEVYVVAQTEDDLRLDLPDAIADAYETSKVHVTDVSMKWDVEVKAFSY